MTDKHLKWKPHGMCKSVECVIKKTRIDKEKLHILAFDMKNKFLLVFFLIKLSMRHKQNERKWNGFQFQHLFE